MLELKDFQKKAALKIFKRFEEYDPIFIGTKNNFYQIPYYQILNSLTASGKTAILTQAVTMMSTNQNFYPIILWISKLSVVVEQSFENLSPGGKYYHLLINNTQTDMLINCKKEAIEKQNVPLLYFATVGTFNQKDKEEGNRTIYQSNIDIQDTSVWEIIKQRKIQKNKKRPLFIVYDEGHNLSSQQTDLLLELQPDAFLIASATMHYSERIIQHFKILKEQKDWTNENLIIKIDPSEVVAAGLIKNTLFLAGYDTSMEETISSMIDNLKEITNLSQKEHNFNGLPKALYVCKTNVVEIDIGSKIFKDNPNCLFNERKVPPILIWNHLVNKCGIKPKNIAVYCDLKFTKEYPKPKEFILFKNGKKDYQEFSQGDFQHIIFNKSLIEGWDDPLVYCAYIDKFMKSKLEIEQVIGRCLRQPKIIHYTQKELNTAHFYIRVDKQEIFQEIIKEIDNKLQKDIKLEIIKSFNNKPEIVFPKNNYYVPKIIQKWEHVYQEFQKIINSIPNKWINTENKAKRTITWRNLSNNKNNQETLVEEFSETNKITVRQILKREINLRFPFASKVIDLTDKKFNNLIGFGSWAYKYLVEKTNEIINVYLNEVELKQSDNEYFLISSISLYNKECLFFKNSIHEKYSDLNELEKKFANELDKFDLPWCRNPSRSGYGIPLLTEGVNKTFYPDFLIWNKDKVIAIDTTGEHLLKDKLTRKLLFISSNFNAKQKLFIYFVSQGKYNRDLIIIAKDGWTLWGLKENRELSVKHRNNLSEIITIILEN